MSIPREFIELLLAKIDLVDLINQHVPLRKKSGNNYFACCPFHNEKSASFSVSQPKQFYYCFGCGVHGNAIDFMMQYERLNFPEAIETLARIVGMEIPQSDSAGKKNSLLPELYALMKEVAFFYYDAMRQSPQAIDYLKKRGITGQIAQRFQLGYAANHFQQILNQFGKTEFDKKKLLDAGLIIKKKEGHYYDRFRERIIFPIHDYRGRIIGFGGRILEQGEPKYLNSPETIIFQKGHELYGLYQSLQSNRKLNRILIVEGYMDVIALFQYGIDYVVATMGTATTEHHLKRLFRYTSEIIFSFDGDAAGRTAAWRALLTLFPIMQDSMQIRFLFLPEKEDPDSLIRKEGKIEFEKRIGKAQSLSEFFLHNISLESDLQTMEGRARFASLGLKHIQQLPTGIFQEILLEELAKRARIDLDALKKQFGNKNPDIISTIEPEITSKTKLPQALHFALALLIQHPHLAEQITEPLPTKKIPGFSFFNKLLEIIQQKKSQESKPNNLTTGSLIEFWRGQKEENFIAKLATWPHMIPETGLENEFLGAIRQLKILVFDDEINRLLAKAANATLSEEERLELTEWIGKKKALLPMT